MFPCLGCPLGLPGSCKSESPYSQLCFRLIMSDLRAWGIRKRFFTLPSLVPVNSKVGKVCNEFSNFQTLDLLALLKMIEGPESPFVQMISRILSVLTYVGDRPLVIYNLQISLTWWTVFLFLIVFSEAKSSCIYACVCACSCMRLCVRRPEVGVTHSQSTLCLEKKNPSLNPSVTDQHH